jgi:hypothetical protein
MLVAHRTEIYLGWYVSYDEMIKMAETNPEEVNNFIVPDEYQNYENQNFFFGERIAIIEPGDFYELSTLGYEMPNIEDFHEEYWPRLVKMGRKDLTRQSAKLFVVNKVY